MSVKQELASSDSFAALNIVFGQPHLPLKLGQYLHPQIRRASLTNQLNGTVKTQLISYMPEISSKDPVYGLQSLPI